MTPASRVATALHVTQGLLAFLCVGLWAYLTASYDNVRALPLPVPLPGWLVACLIGWSVALIDWAVYG